MKTVIPLSVWYNYLVEQPCDSDGIIDYIQFRQTLSQQYGIVSFSAMQEDKIAGRMQVEYNDANNGLFTLFLLKFS